MGRQRSDGPHPLRGGAAVSPATSPPAGTAVTTPDVRPRRPALVAVALVALAAVVGPGVDMVAAQSKHLPPAGLMLVAAEPTVEAIRPPDQPAALDLHTWVASPQSTFELEVRQEAGSYEVWRVVRDRSGRIRQRLQLPDGSVIDPFAGLDGFFELTAFGPDGSVAGTTTAPFCPTGWRSARVSDDGPVSNRYPELCTISPVAEALVWGIERGWATAGPESFAPLLDVEDGDYMLRVAIADRYRRALEIPLERATVELRLEVTTSADPPPESAGPLPSVTHGEASEATAEAREVTVGAGGLPDLVALPAYDVEATTDPERGMDLLAFSTTVWNGGDGPLVVEGFRRAGEPLMDAYQYRYQRGRKVGRSLVGTFEYDQREGHDHWHFTDFAAHRLVELDGTEVASSGKEAFCLAPTDAIDLTLPSAVWRPTLTGLAGSCGVFGALWIRQILEVGWGDTYNQWVPGQTIDISSVPNGDYLLQVTANPAGRLNELRTDNNVASLAVTLGGEPGARTVAPTSP